MPLSEEQSFRLNIKIETPARSSSFPIKDIKFAVADIPSGWPEGLVRLKF